MAGELVELTSEDGPIWVVISPAGGENPHGARDVAGLLQGRVDDVMSGVGGMARNLVRQFRGANLERVTAEFGAQFVLSSGTLVAAVVEAGAECSVRITLEWSPAENERNGRPSV